MGITHLERLRHIRALLTAQGRHGAAAAGLLCFSGAGFTAELAGEAARSAEIRLLTPADLYTGILLPALPPLDAPGRWLVGQWLAFGLVISPCPGALVASLETVAQRPADDRWRPGMRYSFGIRLTRK